MESKSTTLSFKNTIVGEDEKLKNKLKALIVEDNAVNRTLLRNLLKRHSVETQEVENGEEAVILHEAGINFDLILMDNEMPVMDGKKATQMLRSLGVCTKIVGVSSKSRDNEATEFINAGIDGFYVKPMTSSKLAPILKELQRIKSAADS